MNVAPPASSQQAPSARVNVVPSAQTPPRDLLTKLAIGVVVVTALYLGRDIILPVMLAVILAFVLTPIVSFLRRVGIGRSPAVIGTVALTLAFLAALTAIITLQIGQLASDLPRYEATIQSKVSDIRSGVLGQISDIAERLGRQIQRQQDTKPKTPEPASAETATRPIPVEIHSPEMTALQVAQRFLVPVLHPLATTAITFVVLIFILLQREDLRDRVIRLFGSRDLHRTTVAMDDAAVRLSRFFLTQVVLSTIYGGLATLFLWGIGVPGAILCGVIAGLMRFVPYVGSFIATVIPMALAFAVDPGWTTLILAASFFLLGEPAMGYVVEPLVYGQSTGLSPFSVIISTIFWSWLWGPVGLILAMPLTLCLVVLGRHVETFEFLDVILGDRPPLEPAQNFYQRMLADDPDEALEQAETLLKDRSLTRYYDEVALRGLKLAARDAARGVLTAENLQTIRSGVQALIDDLQSTPPPPVPADTPGEATPPAGPDDGIRETWRSDGSVLCVAGRGPLDEAASALLTDVLKERGFGAVTIPHASISRGRLRDIDPAGVRLVCVIYLDIEGAPAHLRYLLRRLRNALPDAPVIVGLWAIDDAIHSDDALRSHLGADHYATSLQDAREQSLKVAQAAETESESKSEAAVRRDQPVPLP